MIPAGPGVCQGFSANPNWTNSIIPVRLGPLRIAAVYSSLPVGLLPLFFGAGFPAAAEPSVVARIPADEPFHHRVVFLRNPPEGLAIFPVLPKHFSQKKDTMVTNR